MKERAATRANARHVCAFWPLSANDGCGFVLGGVAAIGCPWRSEQSAGMVVTRGNTQVIRDG